MRVATATNASFLHARRDEGRRPRLTLAMIPSSEDHKTCGENLVFADWLKSAAKLSANRRKSGFGLAEMLFLIPNLRRRNGVRTSTFR
jgi:hypothetical protein